jgi:hypothetical protein
MKVYTIQVIALHEYLIFFSCATLLLVWDKRGIKHPLKRIGWKQPGHQKPGRKLKRADGYRKIEI